MGFSSERRSASARVCSAMEANTSSRVDAFFIEVGIMASSSSTTEISVAAVRGEEDDDGGGGVDDDDR